MKTKLLLTFLATLFFTQTTHAGTVTGKITRTYVLACPGATAQSNCAIAIIAFSVVIPNAVACQHPSVPSEMAFTLDTVAGKAMYNAALHAQAVGATVTAVGDGTCGGWPDRERPSYMTFAYPQ